MTVFMLVAALGLLLHTCSAATVRVPLVTDGNAASGFSKRSSINTLANGNVEQKLLQPQRILAKHPTSKSPAHIPLDDPLHYESAFLFNVSVGTPPQQVKVELDISGTDTFILAANCTRCTPELNGYNFSTSSSGHRKSSKAYRPNRLAFNVEGQVTEDTVQIGDIVVKQQTFTDSWLLDLVGISYDEWPFLQGIVGLAPSNPAANSKGDSPLVGMAQQELLDSNVFSLRLRDPAELAFGDVENTQYTSKLKKVPLTDRESSFFLNGSWQTTVSYVATRNDPGVRFDLQDRTASFQTLDPFIRLPDDIVWKVLQDLGFEDLFMLPPSVACSRRDSLPDLTFHMGGHNFTLTPYDWTMEWIFEDGKSRCISAVYPMGVPDYMSTEIMFGSAFLRAFYSVFDLDEKTIGFAKLSD